MGESDAAEWSLGSIADLLAVAVLTVAVGVFVLVPPLSGTPVRPVVSLAFVLFAPGYTYLGVLFPKRDVSRSTSNDTSVAERPGGGLGLLERLVFSFGTSVAITIGVGLALGVRTAGITRINLYVGLAALVAVGLPLAAVRRSRLPATTRMRSPHRTVSTRIRSKLAGQGTTANVVTVLCTVSLVVAVVAVGAGLGSSQGGEVTELYLLSENESGEYVPRGYPETVAQGENESFAIGITNQEGETAAYTVVVLRQQFDAENRAGAPTSETRLRTFSATLDDGEAQRIPHTIGPAAGNRSYRVTYLLYVGQPPSDPSIDNAYREVHLWIRGTGSPE
jgi:uncharacterized membrane protein